MASKASVTNLKGFFQSDISYTMPCAKDEMVVWDSFGKILLEKIFERLLLFSMKLSKLKWTAAFLHFANCGHKMFCLFVTPLAINVNVTQKLFLKIGWVTPMKNHFGKKYYVMRQRTVSVGYLNVIYVEMDKNSNLRNLWMQ